MSAQTDTASAGLSRQAPRGGGVAQILWYAHPDTPWKQIGRAIATARQEDSVERSADLLAYFVDANPEWFDRAKYREVHTQ